MDKIWIAVVLAIILVPTAFLINAYFNHPRYGEDFVYIKQLKLNIHFGSRIEDCMLVPIEGAVSSDLLNSKEFITLFDPAGSEKYAVAVHEAQRILVPLGHKVYAANIKPHKNDTTSVRTLSEGNLALPIILLEIGDETSVRRVAPGQIIISGRDDDELNHAACRLDLEILKEVYGIKLP